MGGERIDKSASSLDAFIPAVGIEYCTEWSIPALRDTDQEG
jgi:hypothetical protein